MLYEQEFTAGFEDPDDLFESSLLVHHTTQHQGADHEIYALVRGWQRFGDPVAKLNFQVQAVSLLEEVRFHEWVWVHADPRDACGWEVMKVGAGTGADLQNGSGEFREQSRLVVPEKSIRFHPESRHEPGEDSQTERARTTTELGGVHDGFVGRQDQPSDYSEQVRAPQSEKQHDAKLLWLR
jgi:hypothetical protein